MKPVKDSNSVEVAVYVVHLADARFSCSHHLHGTPTTVRNGVLGGDRSGMIVLIWRFTGTE
jgi:hypothetical protein